MQQQRRGNVSHQKTLYERASRLISEALDRDQAGGIVVAGDSKRIKDLYQSGLALLDRALSLQFGSHELQEARLMEEKIRQVREMVSERLASLAPNMAMQQVGNSAVVQSRENTRTQQKNDEELPASIDRQLARQLLDQVLIPDTKVSFESIAGLKHVKQQISDAIILPALRPDIYTGLLAPSRALLLFGPPGTGKTFLAKAICGECRGYVFLGVSAATVVSKWMGEGEKLIRTLFQLARFLSRPKTSGAGGCILFFDELDSILTRRGESNEQEASRRLKTEFLIQVDGITSDSDQEKLMIIGATNRPQDLDEAVIRRFPKRIYVPLPDADARKELINKLLSSHNHPKKLTNSDIDRIVKITDGYSCSDLTALAKEAALQPLHEFTADEIRSLPELSSSSASKKTKSVLRPLSIQDFIKAASIVKKSVSETERAKVEVWAREFGYTTAS